MAIKVTSITEKMESVITLTDDSEGHSLSDHHYEEMMETFQWLLENIAPKHVVDATKDKFRKEFKCVFNSFLEKIGLDPDTEESRGGIYFRELESKKSTYLEVYCQEVQIIPDRQIVFFPKLQFFLNPSTPARIKTICYLETNRWPTILSLLIDLMPLCYLMEEADLQCELPKNTESLSLRVAPLDKARILMKNLRSLAELLDKANHLYELNDLRAIAASENLKENDKKSEVLAKATAEATKNIFARVLLDSLGIKI